MYLGCVGFGDIVCWKDWQVVLTGDPGNGPDFK